MCCSSELGGLGRGGHGGAGRVQGAGHERQPFQAHPWRARNCPRRTSAQGSLGRSSAAKRGTLDGNIVHIILFTATVCMLLIIPGRNFREMHNFVDIVVCFLCFGFGFRAKTCHNFGKLCCLGCAVLLITLMTLITPQRHRTVRTLHC